LLFGSSGKLLLVRGKKNVTTPLLKKHVRKIFGTKETRSRTFAGIAFGRTSLGIPHKREQG
jgi:hypothetical protein